MWIVGVRDNDERKVPVCRPLNDGEDPATMYPALRTKYPPPRFVVKLALADTVETFQRVYPMFGGGGADGESRTAHPA